MLGKFFEQVLQCYGHFQQLWYHQCREGVRQLEVFTLLWIR